MANEQTSKKVAKKASKILKDPNASDDCQSVAGSALNNAPDKKKPKASKTSKAKKAK